MSSVSELLQRNRTYASDYTPQALISERASGGEGAPKTIIVTCLDARVVPEKFFNLDYGEAIVIRNAGGHIQPALLDILALDALINVDNLLIVRHNDCGSQHINDEMIRSVIRRRAPEKKDEINRMTFGHVDSLEQSVRADIAALRENVLLRKELRENAQGFMWDLKSGLVTKVA